jgi:hypothetical protein
MSWGSTWETSGETACSASTAPRRPAGPLREVVVGLHGQLKPARADERCHNDEQCERATNRRIAGSARGPHGAAGMPADQLHNAPPPTAVVCGGFFTRFRRILRLNLIVMNSPVAVNNEGEK